MGKINYGRVILGGIVGGLVSGFLDWFLNGVLMGKHWDNAARALNRPAAFSGGVFFLTLFGSFIVGGILLIWVYAAIRPRFGAGARTAASAGVVVWALAVLLPDIWNAVIGIFSPRLMLYATAVGIVEVIAGALIGASLYKEAQSSSPEYLMAAEAPQTTR